MKTDQTLDTEQLVITSNNTAFDDIRPCTDAEVDSELKKITEDKLVIDSILRFRYPILAKHIGFLFKPIVKLMLRRAVRNIHSIADFQKRVYNFMRHVINNTTDGFEYIGFDKLHKDKGYLFISNHRDISLDPAFVDMALVFSGLETVRIAIGDNLLKMPAATSLMRLNKSFIVKRSVASPREKLKALSHLSEYIGLSIREGNNVWIAQREGRAKDGDDRTEDAVLKMLALYGRKCKQDFAQYMGSLNIVPVSITYEFDPNAIAKAHELEERASNNGEYKKEQFEDIDTIARGIRGYKGHVRIVAGEPITAGFEDATQLAEMIDAFVINNYQIYPSAKIAAGELEGIPQTEIEKFNAQLAQCPEHLQARVKQMYAKPYHKLKKAQHGED